MKIKFPEDTEMVNFNVLWMLLWKVVYIKTIHIIKWFPVFTPNIVFAEEGS